MHYAELPVPPALDGLVAAIWTIDGDGAADDWVDHDATPDGCIELIRRVRGRSIWGTEQPACFATGLSEAPVRFRMSGDAGFVGIPLWPWAWAMLGGPPAPSFADGWIAVDEPLADIDAVVARLASAEPNPIARHVLAASSVARLVAASGCSHRTVQRWFASFVGMPPRRYLRLIRFRRAMTDIADCAPTLSDHAAKGGFADHAHMARDFRRLAGATPRAARARAKGPFLPGRR